MPQQDTLVCHCMRKCTVKRRASYRRRDLEAWAKPFFLIGAFFELDDSSASAAAISRSKSVMPASKSRLMLVRAVALALGNDLDGLSVQTPKIVSGSASEMIKPMKDLRRA